MSRRGQVIADTSTLLSFASVGGVDLLQSTFDRVQIVPAVLLELHGQNLPANRLLLDSIESGEVFRRVTLPVESRALAERYALIVGRGEAEAIALGKTCGQLVLTEDLAARRLAAREGVAIIGSLGILDLCKRAGFVSSVRPVVEAMRRAGRYFSPELLREYYKRVGE